MLKCNLEKPSFCYLQFLYRLLISIPFDANQVPFDLLIFAYQFRTNRDQLTTKLNSSFLSYYLHLHKH